MAATIHFATGWKKRTWGFSAVARIRKLWPITVTAAAGLVVFTLLAIAVTPGSPLSFDRPVTDALRSLESAALSLFMRVVTYTASVAGTTLVGLSLCWIQWRRKGQIRKVGTIVLALGVPTAIGLLLKECFARSRPLWHPWLVDANGYSFPSGHTLAAVTMGALILWMGRKPGKTWQNSGLAVALSLWVILVGMSRVYLGVHYASDVTASLGAGTTFLSLFYLFAKGESHGRARGNSGCPTTRRDARQPRGLARGFMT